MDIIPKYNVVHKYQKRALLIAINAVAGLSIFFFGYDQGVMGGVNTSRNYVETMAFGYWDASKGEAVVTHTLLKGGIVSLSVSRRELLLLMSADRCLLPAWHPRRRFDGRLAW